MKYKSPYHFFKYAPKKDQKAFFLKVIKKSNIKQRRILKEFDKLKLCLKQ